MLIISILFVGYVFVISVISFFKELLLIIDVMVVILIIVICLIVWSEVFCVDVLVVSYLINYMFVLINKIMNFKVKNSDYLV